MQVEHFNGRPLAAQLERAGIAYRHAPELGGKPRKDREDVVKDDRRAPAPGRKAPAPSLAEQLGSQQHEVTSCTKERERESSRARELERENRRAILVFPDFTSST